MTRTAHELLLYDRIMDGVGREDLKEVTSIAISVVKIELHGISRRIYEASLTVTSQTHILNAAENDDLGNSLELVAVI